MRHGAAGDPPGRHPARRPFAPLTLRRRTVKTRTVPVLALIALLVALAARAADQELLTVAERSNWKATSRYAEVVDYCRRLAQASPVVRLGELGVTNEGRQLPLVII